MSGKNFMSYGDADTILTEFSNDIKSRVSTKANQGLTAQQIANAKANIDIDKVPNVATNDQTPTFLEESTRTNIASGDKLSLIFGKIKKFFSDLKAVAFSGSYNDLSNTPTLVECSTSRNVAAKIVTLPGFKLKTGARISVRFTDTGTSNPASGHITLNVNGTGAKEIVDGHTNMAILGATSGWIFSSNLVNDFIYDGTYWVWMNRDNNTTYSNRAAASGGTQTSLCTTGEKYTWNNKANTSDIPTTLSGLSDDSTHRLVTDTEKTTWSGKSNKKTTMDSYYGTSSTAADTAAKVITVTDSDGNFSLRAGIAIMVKFTAQNTAKNPTFNVNNTGAKSVYYNGAVITTGGLWVGGNTRPARYVYDGTYWVWMGHSLDSNTTYSAMSKAELTTGTATTLRTVRADYLKAGIEELIDGKLPTVPTKLSDLNDDSSHRTVTDTEKSTWNGKSNFSGSYNDLTDKPTIPTTLSQLSTDATHRVVTDTEKTTWNGKVDKTVLGLLQYHTISNIDRPWDSGVEALTITFYRVSDVSQHSGTMPFGNSSFVLCTSHSSRNYGMQFAFSDNPECFASRSLSSGTWTAWKKIGDSDEQIKIRSLTIDIPAVSAGRSTVAYKAFPVISGYKAVGIIGMSCLGNMATLSLNDFFVNNTEAYVSYNNNTSSATTASKVTVDILYIKT